MLRHVSRAPLSLLCPRLASLVDTPRHLFSTTPPDSPSPTSLYAGPFASVTLRLKRVSVATCTIGCFGMPLLVFLNTGEVPVGGQVAGR